MSLHQGKKKSFVWFVLEMKKKKTTNQDYDLNEKENGGLIANEATKIRNIKSN